MKLFVSSVFIVTFSLIAWCPVLAQTNPALGTWKLNPEKSKFASMPAPKKMTRTAEADGDGLKVSYEGQSSDGTPIAFTFTAKYDGKDYPVTGSGQPFGADAIAMKRINAKTIQSTLKKGGAVARENNYLGRREDAHCRLFRCKRGFDRNLAVCEKQ